MIEKPALCETIEVLFWRVKLIIMNVSTVVRVHRVYSLIKGVQQSDYSPRLFQARGALLIPLDG
jgi:hypothetical protein